MNKLYRILGQRGRVTIPYEIRCRVGFSYNDVLSFAVQDDRAVVIRREKICGEACIAQRKSSGTGPNTSTLLQFLDNLSAADQRTALIYLSVIWAKRQTPAADGAQELCAPFTDS